jgi:hypothetical protein
VVVIIIFVIEQVTKASHALPGGPEVQVVVQDDNQDGDMDGDVEMEDEEVPKAKPKQRKPRKTVPVGRNGLKKRRVIRSRTTADEKGYMGIVVTIVGKTIY